ncbi:hypothetical protein HHI36_010107 [Cryptolaemus montrouzieri]|uniref:Uncharacterized protein n=1 Tax=Cryptolaemus montrouzieri TaxID=559131 RepID=A0ABD2MHS6_9CUCU
MVLQKGGWVEGEQPTPVKDQIVMRTTCTPRKETDLKEKRQKLCNGITNIGTWTVLSWYRPEASKNAIQQLEKVKMDMTAVQKIRTPDS